MGCLARGTHPRAVALTKGNHADTDVIMGGEGGCW